MFNDSGSGNDPSSGFGPYIGAALNQANLPKSPLASGANQAAMQGLAPVFQNLINAQSMGNSFSGLPATPKFQFGGITFPAASQTSPYAGNPFIDPNTGQPKPPRIIGATPNGPIYGPASTSVSPTQQAFNPFSAPTNYNPGSIDPYASGIDLVQEGTNPLSLGGISHADINKLDDTGRQALYDQITGAARNRQVYSAGTSPWLDPTKGDILDASGMPTNRARTLNTFGSAGADYLGPEAQDVWSYLLSGGDASASNGGGLTGKFPNPSANFIPGSGVGTQGFRLTPPGQASDVGGNLPPGGGQTGQIPNIGQFPGGYLPPDYGYNDLNGVPPIGGSGSFNQAGPSSIDLAGTSLSSLLSDPNTSSALARLSQAFTAPQVGDYNPSSGVLGGLQGGIPTIANAFQQGGGANIQQGIQDSDYIKNLTQALTNQFTQGKADLRARFGAGGGGSRGTGASFAESQYNSQNLPILASALGQARQAEVGNILANQGQSNQFNLGAGNILSQLAGQSGSQNLGLQGLGSQNILGTQGLNQQGAQGLLQSLLGGGLSLQQQIQQANEAQLNRGFTGNQNIAQIIAALAGSGTPGGSANVNLSPVQQPQGGGLGSALGGFASLLGALL